MPQLTKAAGVAVLATAGLVVLSATAGASSAATPTDRPSPSTSSATASHHGSEHAKKAHKAHKATVNGTVVSVGATSFVMKAKGGHRAFHGSLVTVNVTATTVIKFHGKAITLAQLPTGAKVVVRGLPAADGTVTAERVNVNGHDPKASPSPGAESTNPSPVS
jgi:hypothetical protein